ncbi:MAG: hypothetical protein J0L88_13120 [Xanthomonadales bacterium]|nr:hypothetical protein [Xanthomonadales bacterium]
MKPSASRPAPSRCSRVFNLFALVACIGTTPVHASDGRPNGEPPFRIEQRVIAGGGESRARSACFDLAATLAEPVAGRTSNAEFALTAGFLGEAASRDSIFRSSFEACQP